MGRKRTASKRPVQAAEGRFRKRMKQYEQYQYQGLDKMPEMDLSKYDLDLDKYKQENVMEDMPGMDAYTQAADYASERFQQSQANIMQAYKGAAGSSGVAGIAQAMSGQATEFARGQQMSLGQRAAEARRLSLQEKARLQGQERQLMLQQDVGRRDLRLTEDRTRREFDYGKMTTLLGVEGEQVSGARQMYASELQAGAQRHAGTMQAVGAVAGAKIMFVCVPRGVCIDTIDDSVAIENIKPGDIVIGYNGSPVKVLQKHEYLEDPTAKRFYKVKFDNGSIVDVCDMHRIKGGRAMDITENVISMIEEMAEEIVRLKNK